MSMQLAGQQQVNASDHLHPTVQSDNRHYHDEASARSDTDRSRRSYTGIDGFKRHHDIHRVIAMSWMFSRFIGKFLPDHPDSIYSR